MGKYNDTWDTHELVVTLDLYRQSGTLPQTDERVLEIADLLERTPGSISLRLSNFANRDPEHVGKGMYAGGKECTLIWELYAYSGDFLRRRAARARRAIRAGELQ